MPNPPLDLQPGAPYPGRPELDAANARFRRALARLRKEARHDPALIARHAAFAAEATRELERLAVEAEQAEQDSERHRKALAAENEKLTRTLRRAVRQGAPGARRMLDQHLADIARQNGRPDDDA
ncbi:hypothetical protein [Streptomyces odonnellii]|uniref:hypothetical protein n=1 Tax=Streptomyces odonnellii TaxID=1417980 RepID=UPI000A8F95AD|nr:hypothetical protein [Streptomyces odonnellii]